MQRYVSTLDSSGLGGQEARAGPSSPKLKVSKKGTTVSVKVLLRHPTHNVPDLVSGGGA